jgi:hypothetical protein
LNNSNGRIFKEFRLVLMENGRGHRRIGPLCPQENCLIERARRMLGEGLDGDGLLNHLEFD